MAPTIRNGNSGAGWVSYLGEGVFCTEFSVVAARVVSSNCLRNVILAFSYPLFFRIAARKCPVL